MQLQCSSVVELRFALPNVRVWIPWEGLSMNTWNLGGTLHEWGLVVLKPAVRCRMSLLMLMGRKSITQLMQNTIRSTDRSSMTAHTMTSSFLTSMGTWSTQSSRSQCICSKMGKNAAQRNLFSLVRTETNWIRCIRMQCNTRCEGSTAPSVCCVPLNASGSASRHFGNCPQETDYATNFAAGASAEAGPWSDSGLGEAFRGAFASPETWWTHRKTRKALKDLEKSISTNSTSTWTSWVCANMLVRRKPNYKGVSFRRLFWHFLLV